MSIIRYKNHFARIGTTDVNVFYGDMHDLTFRSDKVITDFNTLREQVERFEADRSNFDYIDYSGNAKLVKSKRDYDCLVEKLVDLDTITFLYNGSTYRVRTKSITTVDKIYKLAHRILSHRVERVCCLVWDKSNTIVAEGQVIDAYDKSQEII